MTDSKRRIEIKSATTINAKSYWAYRVVGDDNRAESPDGMYTFIRDDGGIWFDLETGAAYSEVVK